MTWTGTVCAKDAAGPRFHTVPLQYLQASVPVQVIIRIVQAHKDRVQDLLPHGRKLLKQLGLNKSSTYVWTRPETMEYVVEGDGGIEAEI